ncbi:response regulator transcription factor [Frankia sp. AgKG'84/4]
MTISQISDPLDVHTAGGPGAELHYHPASPAKPTNVMICASSPLAQAGLRSVLQVMNGMLHVVELDSQQVAKIMRSVTPDVVILHDSCDVGSGVGLVRQIQASALVHPARVVVMTQYDEAHHITDYLAAGARGLIRLDSSEQEILRALCAVRAGHAHIAPEVASRLVNFVLGRLPPVGHVQVARLRDLTGREREVFRLVAAGMSNSEVAQGLNLSEKTVKFHVSNILFKLDLRTRVQAVLVARLAAATAGEY